MPGGSIMESMLCGPHWVPAVTVPHPIPGDADADGVAKVQCISLLRIVYISHHNQVAYDEMCTNPLPPS